MADPKGFLKVTERELPPRRPVPVRIMDWKEVYEPGDTGVLRRQAGRCMDCGIPFCHQGCPLGNLIPEWNDLTWRGEGRSAIERLHATNNFPEFTGRLCPAPCESSCVLGINQPAVTIKQIEVSIIDEAFANGWVEPEPPGRLTGKTVAVVGSGPAGLAAAQQLTRAGHTVAVFERDDRIGGLLRYGIPDFKMEKRHLESRLRQMQDEGTRFRAGVEIGKDISWSDLRARYDAVVDRHRRDRAARAADPRPRPRRRALRHGVPRRVEPRDVAGDSVPNQITAEGKHVVVIGGGDTGADCIGTAHRQGALSVTNLAIGTRPPGGAPRAPAVADDAARLRGAVRARRGRRALVPRVDRRVPRQRRGRGARAAGRRDRVRRRPARAQERHRARDPRRPRAHRDGLHRPGARRCSKSSSARSSPTAATCRATDDYQTTAPGVFVAGDAGRGQSLIVWAIAEGRAAAAHVDQYLMGETELPAPVRPTDVAIGLQPA